MAEQEREKPTLPDGYVMVMKKKQPPPWWLKEHQERFKGAMKAAGERTAHLKGPERVREMNRLAREMLKAQPESAPSSPPDNQVSIREEPKSPSSL